MTPLAALILFAAWTLLLMFVAVNHRVIEILKGVPANSWTRGSAREVPAWVKRCEHAHFNCLENLPVFATLVFAAIAMPKITTAFTMGAPIVLYMRLGQSIIHLLGTSPMLVLVRATLFTVQVVIFFWMIWSLLS